MSKSQEVGVSLVLALDQGTTSSRAILFNRDGRIQAAAQKEFRQIFPQAGWEEHDPEENWASQRSVAVQVLRQAGLSASGIRALRITNPPDTPLARASGQRPPIYNTHATP